MRSLVLITLGLALTATASAAPFDHRWTVLGHDPGVLASDVARLEQAAAAAERSAAAAAPSIIAWVIFTDKGILSDADYALARQVATAQLTAAGRERRAILGSPDLVDYLDLPVRADYIAQVRSTGAQVRHVSRWINAVSVAATADDLRRAAALSGVSRILPVARGRRGPLPDAPEPPPQAAPAGGHLLNYGASEAQLDEIQVTLVHDLGYSGNGVIVTMLDSGYYKDHLTFATLRAEGRLIAERDFINGDLNAQNEIGDPLNQHDHGTYTWSALGGATSGELYGPAYGATFAIAKTEDVSSETQIEEDHWLAGSEWADSLGADIISSSLGYLDWYTYDDMDGHTAVTTNAADIAASRNILVATAAGNEGSNTWFYIIAPADADSVLACGAVTSMNVVASFSSHGPTADGRIKPEVCARGVGTHCATATGPATYGNVSGTSLSTPLVGGSAALVLEAHPTWDAMRVRRILMLTADTAANPDNSRGFGRLQVLDAINWNLVAVAPSPTPVIAPLLQVTPNPFAFPATIELAVPAATGPVVVDVFAAGGLKVARLTTGSLGPGRHPLTWDGRDAGGSLLAAGVYFLRASGDGWDARTKLVIAR